MIIALELCKGGIISLGDITINRNGYSFKLFQKGIPVRKHI